MAAIVNGLTREIKKGKLNATPYAVLTIQCGNCGTRDDYKDSETSCHGCKHTLDKRNLRANVVKKGQTAEILSNEVKWKCPNCGKLHDQPNACCIREWAFKADEFVGRDPIEAYQCQECLILYKRPVVCHSGSLMIKGKVLPNRSHEEFAKIKQKMTEVVGANRPIKGMIQ